MVGGGRTGRVALKKIGRGESQTFGFNLIIVCAPPEADEYGRERAAGWRRGKEGRVVCKKGGRSEGTVR